MFTSTGKHFPAPSPVRGQSPGGRAGRTSLRRIALGAAVLIAGAGAAASLLGGGAANWRPTRHAQADPACDVLRGVCTAARGSGAPAALRLLPAGAGGLLDVEFDLGALDNASAQAVRLDLAGASMAMGPNRTELQRQADGRWRARTALTACLSGPMRWVATVTVDGRWQREVLRYRFESASGAAQ